MVLVLTGKNFISDPDRDNPVCHPALSVLIITMQHKETMLSGMSHHFEDMNSVLLQGCYYPDSNSL